MAAESRNTEFITDGAKMQELLNGLADYSYLVSG